MSNDQVMIFLIDFKVNDNDKDRKNYSTAADKIELLKYKMRTNYGYILRPLDSFLELNCTTRNLITNLKHLGFKKPTAEIHRLCISPMMNSKPPLDIICQVNLYTEKIIAYSVAIIERIQVIKLEKESARCLQAIVMVSNYQIADQVTEILQQLTGEYGLRIGRESSTNNIENSDVLVGIPKFIMDHFSLIDSNNLKMLILDCNSEMFLNYNIENLRILFEYSRSAQICLFGTPKLFKDNLAVMEEMKHFMKSPLYFSIKDCPIQSNIRCIKHFYIMVEREDWKYETLLDLKDYIHANCQFLIFCNSDKTAKTLTKEWSTTQQDLKSLTEDMNNDERELVRREFLNGLLRNLITTNEFSNFNLYSYLIINYDIPYNNEQYVQRLYCNGHFEKKIVLNFVKREDIIRLREIEEFFAISIDECPMNINELV